MASLKDLNPASVEQIEEQLVQLVSDEYPSMDLSRGRVLRDLVIRPAAMLAALNEFNMDQLRRSMSLQQIATDPTLANDDIVDGVLSNLLLQRDPGAAATGQIRVIVSARVVTPVESGSVFTSGGMTFTTPRAYVGVVTATNVVDTGSRLITQRSDGTFEFIVDVVADETGSDRNVASGSRFTTTASIPRLVDLVAAGDFSGGRPTDSNADLVAKVQNGISPRVLSGRSHIAAMLQENFAIHAISIIGYGDVEMRRDAHNMFEIGSGGKTDIYAWTDSSPRSDVIKVSATLIDADEKTFAASMSRDQMAGVYVVLGVYPTGTSPTQEAGREPSYVDSKPIVSQDWSADLSGDGFVPSIQGDEAAFTRYRSMVLRFTDTATTITSGSSDYDVHVLRMPLIDSIQDFVNERSRRGPAADYLVRAPIPALCSIGISVEARSPSEVDVDAIRRAVANRVHSLGFSVGHLPASVIIDAAQDLLPVDAVIDLPIAMLAKIYMPDGSMRTINGSDELRAPDVDSELVSSRTMAFFVRIDDIDVSVASLSAAEI